jgi:RNA polymerase sigma factor for flagellar operon FliA
MSHYVRGAIRDSLRDGDWAPRLVQYRSRIVQEAVALFENAAGRRPSDEELTKELEKAGHDVQAVLKDARRVMQSSLSRAFFEDDSGRSVTSEETLSDPDAPDPVTQTQRRELRDLITRGLTRGERLILILYYYENMTMKEIGATLDLSESRVSQMHSSIIMRLKAQMANKDKEFVTEEQ